MASEHDHQANEEGRKKKLGERLDALGWGLFLVMIGGLGLRRIRSLRMPGS